MKKVFQLVYKGMYTNEISVINFRNMVEFEEALEAIKKSENLILICTNIAYKH